MKVSARMGLSGYTPATFGTAAAQASFTAGLSAVLRVRASDITITGTAAYTTTAAGHRRLLDAGVEVAFYVAAADGTTATALAASLTAVAASPAALVTALQSAGLMAVTSLAVTSPPLVTVVPAPAPSAISAAPRGALGGCAHAVAALAVAALALI